MNEKELIAKLQKEVEALKKQVEQPEMDMVVGFCMNGKRNDGTPARFTLIYVYLLDPETKKPIPTGEKWTDSDGNEHDQYKIGAVFRIADSSLEKVKDGQSRKCNLYQSRGY